MPCEPQSEDLYTRYAFDISDSHYLLSVHLTSAKSI